MTITCLLIILALLSAMALPLLDKLLAGSTPMREKNYRSKISGPLRIWRPSPGEKWLIGHGCVQGICAYSRNIEQSYWALMAGQVLAHCRHQPSAQVLVLGLGANTSSSLISRQAPHIEQTIVEIDPVVVLACNDHFGLAKQPRTTVLIADGYHLLAKPPAMLHHRFDAVIVDLFTGIDSFSDPPSAHHRFLRSLLHCTAADAILVFNQPAYTRQTQRQSDRLQQRLRAIAQSISVQRVYDPRGFVNDVIRAASLKMLKMPGTNSATTSSAHPSLVDARNKE